MRGKVIVYRRIIRIERITPAYAGKSVIDTLVTLPSVGSPPPMRGKAARSSCGLLSRGITPAYAGKSSVDAGDAWKRRDHPRLCGEKGNSKGLRGARWGSPPPMRGKGTPFASSFSPRRITPAYAGKRCCWHRLPKEHWDHPRLCGEKLCEDNPRAAVAGSPPPMRGKVQTVCDANGWYGITPAYAGKRTDIWS